MSTVVWQPGKGKCVIAVDTIREGDCINRELPFASEPLYEKRTIVCAACRSLAVQPESGYLPCPKCKQAFYCAECWNSGLSARSHPCELYRRLEKMTEGTTKPEEGSKPEEGRAEGTATLTDHQRTLSALAYRCYQALTRDRDFSDNLLVAQNSTSEPNVTSDSQNGTTGPFQVDAARSGGCGDFVAQCHHGTLRGWMDAKLIVVSDVIDVPITALRAMLVRFQMNAFYATDASFKPHSACVYVLSSLLNHACVPNAICQYNGVEVAIRALRRIEPGEEVCIAYVDLLRPYPERKEVLDMDYTFTCKCSACRPRLLPAADTTEGQRAGALSRARYAELASFLRSFAISPKLNALLTPNRYELFMDPDRGLYTDCQDQLVIEKDLLGFWNGVRNVELHNRLVQGCKTLDELKTKHGSFHAHQKQWGKEPDEPLVSAQQMEQLILTHWRLCKQLTSNEEFTASSVNPLNKSLYGLRSELYSLLYDADALELALVQAEFLLTTLTFVYADIPNHPQIALLLNAYLDIRHSLNNSPANVQELYKRVHRAYRAVYGGEHAYTRVVQESLAAP
ncbi:SET domain protein [Gregarina niphandrodes]|uniref:SET domain protein n=1 Tax=Gregarina niphandrodes TaxID=110365 RepID=A0A023B120_GRENI|nr:SET domain protein [Gregarina niphandrodes]EZG46112.1 SET domain protein [Gregarina niphandrodes]|eukprot:XP_011132368.1 SET domain protein [Gregarina niphandrodes]